MWFPQMARPGRYAVVDVETTGFSPSSDRVVEVACVVVQSGRVVKRWSTMVNPERPIPAYATGVHGIADEDVAQAPTYAEIEGELFALCDGATVVAHNASFDLSFLTVLQARPVICTLALARRAFPDAPNHKNQTLRRTSASIAIRPYADSMRTARWPMHRSPRRSFCAASIGSAGKQHSGADAV